MKERVPPGYIIDGELFLQDWNTTVSVVKSPKKKIKAPIKLYAFGIFTEEEFKEKKGKTSYLKYKKHLRDLFRGAHWIEVTPQQRVQKAHKAQKIYQDHIRQGHEGTMFKQDEPYSFGRDWAKAKKFETIDLEVVGAKEGTGQFVGALGALLVDYKGKRMSVGGGYNVAQRRELWQVWQENPDALIGSKIEVRHWGETKNTLRHPIFVRFVELK